MVVAGLLLVRVWYYPVLYCYNVVATTRSGWGGARAVGRREAS